MDFPMRQCFVCGDVITEPVSAYARNICRRCATAPPEVPLDLKEPEDEEPQNPLRASKLQVKKPRQFNLPFLRGTACFALGVLLTAHTVSVLLFGGILHSLLVGGGIALLIIGLLDLYYWFDD